LHSCLSFFRCIFIVQRVFTMVFHPWIYCTLIRFTLFITLPYFSNNQELFLASSFYHLIRWLLHRSSNIFSSAKFSDIQWAVVLPSEAYISALGWSYIISLISRGDNCYMICAFLLCYFQSSGKIFKLHIIGILYSGFVCLT
jgi:hypothetical protein